jgi:hypothetical protein
MPSIERATMAIARIHPSSAGLRNRGLAIAFGLVLAAAAILGSTQQLSASAAPVAGAASQCNGIDNGGGRAVECDVTVTNYLDVQTNVSSSIVVARACTAAAGAAPLCTVVPASFPTATTAIDQCNGSGLGGGATVTCRVTVVNTIIGDAALAPATIDQCNGSGTGGGTEPTLNCSPLGTTSDATISQCNGSANGGGGQRRVTCTVEASTQSTVLPVTIKQCNGSAAAGSLVTCGASLTHRILPAGTPVPAESTTPAAPTQTPTPTVLPVPPVNTETASPVAPAPTASPAPTVAASPLIPRVTGSSATALADSGANAQLLLVIAGGAVLLGGILFATVLIRRRSQQH